MEPSQFEDARTLFIRRWGEMGTTWGISRTMAEIHALLYLSTEPLCTDHVMERLSISRGSASINLRELVNWELIHRVHRRGDRKEYFEAEKEVWRMFETIIRERRRREVLPIMETIERSLRTIDDGKASMSGQAREEAEEFRTRFTDILEFCETMNGLFDLITKAGRSGLGPIAKTIAKIAR